MPQEIVFEYLEVPRSTQLYCPPQLVAYCRKFRGTYRWFAGKDMFGRDNPETRRAPDPCQRSDDGDVTTMTTNKPKSEIPFGVKVAVSVVAAILIVLQLYWQVPIDGVTLGLLAIALLPWIFHLIENMEVLGIFRLQTRIQSVEERQHQQDAQIRVLRFLVTSLLREWEKNHLNQLDSNEAFLAKETGFFRQEMKDLWDRGLIGARHGESSLDEMLEQAPPDGDREVDVKRYFYITDKGKEYLEFLGDYAGLS